MDFEHRIIVDERSVKTFERHHSIDEVNRFVGALPPKPSAMLFEDRVFGVRWLVIGKGQLSQMDILIQDHILTCGGSSDFTLRRMDHQKDFRENLNAPTSGLWLWHVGFKLLRKTAELMEHGLLSFDEKAEASKLHFKLAMAVIHVICEEWEKHPRSKCWFCRADCSGIW